MITKAYINRIPIRLEVGEPLLRASDYGRTEKHELRKQLVDRVKLEDGEIVIKVPKTNLTSETTYRNYWFVQWQGVTIEIFPTLGGIRIKFKDEVIIKKSRPRRTVRALAAKAEVSVVLDGDRISFQKRSPLMRSRVDFEAVEEMNVFERALGVIVLTDPESRSSRFHDMMNKEPIMKIRGQEYGFGTPEVADFSYRDWVDESRRLEGKLVDSVLGNLKD